MPIPRTSIEASVLMTTTNELSNGNVKTKNNIFNIYIKYNSIILFRKHKRQI